LCPGLPRPEFEAAGAAKFAELLYGIIVISTSSIVANISIKSREA